MKTKQVYSCLLPLYEILYGPAEETTEEGLSLEVKLLRREKNASLLGLYVTSLSPLYKYLVNGKESDVRKWH